MVDGGTTGDLARLAVPLAGALEETGDRWLPFRLTDPAGVVVEPVSAFFADLLAAGRSEATIRSYGMDLLRWFRFLWAAGVPWDTAIRAEARDFCRWMQVAGKPARPHWRAPERSPVPAAARGGYAPSVRAHSETVLRCFYEFHLETGTGPIVNPFPLDRSRRGRRANAHHNPMEPYRDERAGLYRPKVPSPDPAQRPGRGVQRDLRPAALAPGPGAGRVLRLDRGAGLGAAVGHPGRRRPGPAVDHRGPQGHPGGAGAAGLDRRVRVAAPLPGWRWTGWSRRGAASRCGGRCGARSGR